MTNQNDPYRETVKSEIKMFFREAEPRVLKTLAGQQRVELGVVGQFD